MSSALYIPPDPRRMSTALVLSLLIHALLLSLAIGGQTFGLPGLQFPWKDKHFGVSDLHILLAPPVATTPDPVPADIPTTLPPPIAPPPVASNLEQPVMLAPAAVRSEPAAVPAPAPAPAPAPPVAPAAPAEPAMAATKRPEVNLPVAPNAPQVRAPANTVARDVPVQASEEPAPAEVGDAAQKKLEQETKTRALELARLEEEKQTAERLRQAEVVAAAQREAVRQEQLRQDAVRAEQAAMNEAARIESERKELARQENLRQEAQRQEQERAETARQEAARKEAARQEQAKQTQLEAARREQAQADARQEAVKQEAARQEALKQEAARQEATKQEAARQDAVRREAARQEAARQEAARQDALKQEAARRDAAKQEAARQEAARQEAARQDAQNQEAARRDAAKQEAARQEAAKQEAARQERAKQDQAQQEKAKQEAEREERLRAIGKQLNEEAAQRDAANRPSKSLLPTVSSLRRGWLFGRADPNADLVLYAETMSRKIEMNMTLDMIRDIVKQRHVPPTVTVAVRADGTVEKVTFVVSSGVPAIDEAIRKVVASQAPYGAFPPALARQYDVVEIRRTWIFDTAIRLQ